MGGETEREREWERAKEEGKERYEERNTDGEAWDSSRKETKHDTGGSAGHVLR